METIDLLPSRVLKDPEATNHNEVSTCALIKIVRFKSDNTIFSDCHFDSLFVISTFCHFIMNRFTPEQGLPIWTNLFSES